MKVLSAFDAIMQPHTFFSPTYCFQSFSDILFGTVFLHLLHFREIFYVTEEMLCVPKLHVPIPTCMLRVVNNDTGEEIPRVFQKVAPYVYKRNKVCKAKSSPFLH